MIAPILAVTMLAAVPSAGAPDPEALLRDSDRARGALPEGVTWTVVVDSTEDGETTRRSFLVRARGVDALCEALAPPRHKGEVFLFNDRTIWFVKPGLRRPIAISARQRLQGDAATGDITSTNYARDYTGTVAGEDVVDGDAAWRLDLVARTKSVTYDRIRYWVSKKRRLGVKAEFLTVSGEIFKTASIEYGVRVREPGGAEVDFPSKVTIRDAVGAGNVTTLTYESPRAERHSPAIFNVNNVAR